MRSPTSVLHVAHNVLPHVGGLEAVVAAETRGLADRGHDVTVVGSTAETEGGRAPGASVEDGVRVVRVRAWHGLERHGVPFPVFSPLLLPVLWREVRRADLVHIHDVLYLSSWVAAVCCRITRTPYVVHRHVGFVHHPDRLVRLVQGLVLTTLGRVVTRGASRLLAIDDHVAADLRSSGTTVPVEVLGNGVDTARFHPVDETTRRATRSRLGLPTDRVLALFVGRFVPKKGFGHVLESRGATYDLVFVGGDRPPGLDPTGTHFLGALPAEELPAVYAAVDVMVVASVGECPLTVLEAMASGLPLVINDDPALHTAWTTGAGAEAGPGSAAGDGPGVRFVDVSTPALATALAHLAADPESRRRMGMRNREHVADRFSWHTHVDRIDEIYVTLT